MSMRNTPYIDRKNGHPVLMVEDSPFILLAGEVHNSDASSPEYMEKIWDTADQLGMNALLLPVSWELIEPEEGRFDFSVPKALIDQARKRSLRIVFLWFGSWKNAECMYAPAWVKQDLDRFPRAQVEKGRNKTERKISPTCPELVPYTTLSYLGEETKAADSNAFSALMCFLKDYDGEYQTVVAVQVENETGLLGAAREHSDEADALFEADVPTEFADWMRAHTDTMTEELRTEILRGEARGNWYKVFNAAAEEVFSAYYVARYVNSVAESGKAVYPLPMTANCWLDGGGEAGFFPSGGPVSRMQEVWDFCAPAIDAYAPDIYSPQYKDLCDEYSRRNRLLFIAECATHSYCAPRLLYTIGHYHAMCYSPFGFDDIGKPFSIQQGMLFGMDVNDPALKTPQSFEEYAAFGHVLREMMPMLADAYGTDRLKAVSAETDPSISHTDGSPSLVDLPTMDFGAFRVSVCFQSSMNSRSDGACLGLKISDTECWLVGNACRIHFSSGDTDAQHLDFLSIEEGRFENGTWIPGRRLNGDEASYMFMNRPSVWHLQFFTYH